MSERLADLDELVLRCRDKSTKEYIQEAVTCYRAGAFRSCIVSTWNAVVFDFIHKLRQLEQTGHKNAKKQLDDFEDLRANNQDNNNISKILAFEKSVPDLALKEYEFISPLEYYDLKRLLEDRNRCAHPSMQSLEETFQASAELARYHLRNAVMHLLQHPPVQGRAALKTIWDQISAELFPMDVDEAVITLRSGPLARARRPLVRGVIIGLTKDLLLTDRPKTERNRQFAALQAISKMYFEESEDILKTELSKIADGVSDPNWAKMISYLRHIKAWEFLSEAHQTKTRRFIENVANAAATTILVDALNVVELRYMAVERVKKLSPEVLVQNFQHELSPNEIIPITKDYIQSVVDSFINSSYAVVQANGENLLLVASLLSSEQMLMVLQAFCDSEQINSALGIPEIFQQLFCQTLHLAESVKLGWLSVRKMIDKDYFKRVTSITALKEQLDLQFPDFLSDANANRYEGKQ
ncbi:hypothetical protein [Anabaena sp. UHCC 0204]|jgi:hypothetical protein|uniref:hypothetical protein n=1 Tax=Anabaena sp. UHCC 0204 TaxID=2590009 RepID=UPI0014488AB5|nr:hypothetical protein [Anabaena sp. UHCC 0204]MTJ06694.1 hypothetical protein [Anabaena sp. UHCC 0204]